MTTSSETWIIAASAELWVFGDIRRLSGGRSRGIVVESGNDLAAALQLEIEQIWITPLRELYSIVAILNGKFPTLRD